MLLNSEQNHGQLTTLELTIGLGSAGGLLVLSTVGPSSLGSDTYASPQSTSIASNPSFTVRGSPVRGPSPSRVSQHNAGAGP